MSQKSLAKQMKLIITLLGVCGAALYCAVMPIIGLDLADSYPELAYCFWPWIIFLGITAIPCYTVLVLGWQIASSIARDETFTSYNAKRLKQISMLALITSVYVFVGNFIFLLLNMTHFSVFLAFLLVVFIGIAISVAAAVLSHLVTKAADLQQQSDLTI